MRQNKIKNNTTLTKKEEAATNEYTRLITLFKNSNVDEVKLKLYDELIKKVAELYGILEDIKKLPTVIYNRKNPFEQKETPVGKARVKYMAQYSTCMQKLVKDLLGAVVVEDDELDEYE